LGSSLQAALQGGGPVAAIGFCNEQALAITRTYEDTMRAEIKRVSDRPRNPGNAASDRELEYIRTTKAIMKSGEKPQAALREIDGRMVGYYPIATNGMCLQCHGNPGADIAPDTLAMLKSLYPRDKALGYGANELRGIWVISMEKATDDNHDNDQDDDHERVNGSGW